MKFNEGSVTRIILFLWIENIATQRTVLDEKFGKLYRPLRLLGLNHVDRSRVTANYYRRMGKAQQMVGVARSLNFFCDTKNGPGKRSDVPPTSVHRLRPGDIDIIGALGDSLTAGNGILASNILQIAVENRGVVWSIGGQGNWRQYLTLPNILKEFNPNLYGYSLSDGLSTDRSSKFNVAELGAMSRDIPYEAKIFVSRLKADRNVNVTHHWKLLTILIGNNDFCSDICYYPNPEKVVEWHEQNMLKTLRFLRDNVPRLMVNIVPPPNLRLLTKIVGLPPVCQATLRFECPCLIGKREKELDYFESIMLRWIALDSKIAYRKEFNTEVFTVNIQPFTQFGVLPKTPNGTTDFQNLSVDCFHLSQKGHASSANALWNNMLETEDQKSRNWLEVFQTFKCPTLEKPYLSTKGNNYNITTEAKNYF